MSIKLSNYYWFRNNYLMPLLDSKEYQKDLFGKKLSLEDRKNLKFIVEELDELKEDSYFQKGESLISENIMLMNLTEIKDVTSNPELAASYLKGIHTIMEKYPVQIELYRQLGRCFEELGLKPNPDISKAVKYANEKIGDDDYSSLKHMCWKTLRTSQLLKAKQ